MTDDVKVADKTDSLTDLKETDEDLRLPSVVEPAHFPVETIDTEARHQTPAVGQRATRPDGRLHGLGQTKYIDDITFPNMLFAKMKRAGISSALIKSIDTSEAEAMPGVTGGADRQGNSGQLLWSVLSGSAGLGRRTRVPRR